MYCLGYYNTVWGLDCCLSDTFKLMVPLISHLRNVRIYAHDRNHNVVNTSGKLGICHELYQLGACQ